MVTFDATGNKTRVSGPHSRNIFHNLCYANKTCRRPIEKSPLAQIEMSLYRRKRGRNHHPVPSLQRGTGHLRINRWRTSRDRPPARTTPGRCTFLQARGKRSRSSRLKVLFEAASGARAGVFHTALQKSNLDRVGCANC